MTDGSSNAAAEPTGALRRVLVVGSTGAGKTTMARALSRRLDLAYHEMDALYFGGPGWRVNETFAEEVGALAEGPRWVVDSLGYPAVRDLLWEKADTIVWLDYPRRVIMPRVLRRSLRRSLLRERIFGGNRETWSGWLTRDHPAWSAWTGHAARRAEIARRVGAERFAPLHVVRLSRPAHAAAWLRARG
ncbi:adenylate kinase [Streptomyces fuscigenes]|uniref:adenylate kinase n=1 Tax=Streptomyces fuscigenes TaxID=1528880 RepID=UPI001F25EE4E|nr:adenylate kinase [Streptomyces fuscigenes]MCF3964372.1 adenylate kinase [Streptomyces fuscigenes]